MATFNNAVLTEKGNELLVETMTGTQIEFIRVETGSGIYDGTEDLPSMSSLKNKQQEFPFLRFEKVSEESILLVAIISNEELAVGYRITEIGVYGKLKGSDEEILCSVATAVKGEADFWPSFNGVAPMKMILRYHITLSPNAEPCITLADNMVLAEIAAESIRAYEAEQGLLRQISTLDQIAQKLNRIAFSGLYTDLKGCPTNLTDFNNDANYQTTDTWNANTLENDGYVTKGAGHVNQVWGTDEKGNPGWRPIEKDTFADMDGASESAAGKSGLVPAPPAGKQNAYFRGDGKWVEPINSLLATEPGRPLDAVQGKELKDLIDELINSFQAGVDTLYSACVSCGATPADKSPAAIEAAINTIFINRYNAGVTAGKSTPRSKEVRLSLSFGDSSASALLDTPSGGAALISLQQTAKNNWARKTATISI